MPGGLIGRDADLARVAELLDASPVVTLTGVGGVGKTTLARACADAMAARMADGIVWIDLAPVADRDGVVAAFMAALDVKDLGGRHPVEAAGVALRGRQVLLVADNAEHVADAVGELVTLIVRDVPGLGALVTSREPLTVPGESRFVVGPLGQDMAEKLFVARTREIVEDYAVTAEDAPAVTQICRGLDGIPLAIEFSAAQMSSLGAAGIAASLERVLEFGREGAVTRPRHITLRAAFSWSHELLPDSERILLRRLATFSGSFARDSVEAVCGDDGLEPGEIAATLRRLVERSLVVPPPPEHGELRYRLLETVRQFAHDQLEQAGELETIESRHAAYFVDLAETAELKLRTAQQLAWHRRLRADYDNIVAVLQRSAREPGGLSSDGARIAVALAWWWMFFDGRQSEAFRWLEEAATRLHAPDADTAVAKAALLSSVVAFNRGDLTAMSTKAAEALPVLDGVEPWHAVLARLIVDLPTLAADPEERRAHLANWSREFADAGDDGFGELLVATAASQIALWTGDLDGRRTANEWRLEIARRMGDTAATVLPLAGLALGALQEGDPERAAPLLVEAVDAARPLQSGLMTPTLLAGVAGVAVARSDWARASRLLGATDGLLERSAAQINSGNRAELDAWIARCRTRLGDAEFERARDAGWPLSADAAIAMAEDVLAGRAPEVGDGTLTRRQREVAELVAQGKSNREIAVALMISQHTAERHVENILKRLRLNSRVQIATRFHSGSYG